MFLTSCPVWLTILDRISNIMLCFAWYCAHGFGHVCRYSYDVLVRHVDQVEQEISEPYPEVELRTESVAPQMDPIAEEAEEGSQRPADEEVGVENPTITVKNVVDRQTGLGHKSLLDSQSSKHFFISFA